MCPVPLRWAAGTPRGPTLPPSWGCMPGEEADVLGGTAELCRWGTDVSSASHICLGEVGLGTRSKAACLLSPSCWRRCEEGNTGCREVDVSKHDGTDMGIASQGAGHSWYFALLFTASNVSTCPRHVQAWGCAPCPLCPGASQIELLKPKWQRQAPQRCPSSYLQDHAGSDTASLCGRWQRALQSENKGTHSVLRTRAASPLGRGCSYVLSRTGL